jgi:hypothetical protein
MTTLSPLTWIGNAAAVLTDTWSAVAKQARAADCSRQAAYQQAHHVHQAVAELQGDLRLVGTAAHRTGKDRAEVSTQPMAA